MTEQNKKPSLSPLAEAIKGHDAEMIGKLAASGAKLRENEAPAKLMAEGFNPDDLDQFHSQSAPRIASTLQAATKAGIDINAPVDGEPASHFLTRKYVTRQVANDYDTSYAAMVGMTDGSHMTYLQTYAENGVDFSQRNEKGQTFTTVGEKAAEDYAKAEAPRTLKADYEPAYDGDQPPFSRVKAEIVSDLKDVKRAALSANMTAQASQKAAERPAPKRAAQKGADLEL